ncbi:hypothetical protein [Sinorhizobium medicae]|uniref:hypothetical protein n=1 Tax=Sinorhizobium medicae TaxID=110321 RepID=UPI003088B76B|nr:hypothetical protein U8C38_30840 [Sinorhizobium medicae]
MDGAGFGIVQDAETEDEGQWGRVPELEQRPGDSGAEQYQPRQSLGVASAGIRFGNQLLEVDIDLSFLKLARGTLPTLNVAGGQRSARR